MCLTERGPHPPSESRAPRLFALSALGLLGAGALVGMARNTCALQAQLLLLNEGKGVLAEARLSEDCRTLLLGPATIEELPATGRVIMFQRLLDIPEERDE